MKNLSRRRRASFALAALPLTLMCTTTLVRGCQDARAASPESAKKPAITIANYSFHPATLTVKKDSTVIWINGDDDVHTIKSMEGPEAFSSPALDSGSRFAFTFHRPGAYHYICSVHPYMHGVIMVR